MLSRFFRREKKLPDDKVVETIVTQTAALIHDLNDQMNLRFKELSSQLKELELGLAQMETKLLTKDLKDKQAYGLLHYKLHETKSHKIQDEISELEEKLLSRKTNPKDQ